MKNYAITFSLDMDKVKTYGISTEEAHEKIKEVFRKHDFTILHKNGTMYLSGSSTISPMRSAFNIVDEFKEIEWFSKSVHGFALMRVDDLSDFTDEFK